MRLRKLVLMLLVAMVLCAVAPLSGYASFYNSRSTSADAWWDSWDWSNGDPGPADATESWNVSGYTSAGIFKDAGVSLDSVNGSTGWVSKMSYTPAVGEEPAKWVNFDCMQESPDLAFGKALGSASLEFLAEGTLNVWEGAEPWVQVGPDEWEMREPDESTTDMCSVVATWKATGPLTRSTYTSRDRTADFFWADRSNQMSRRAVASVLVVGASGAKYMDSSTLANGEANISENKSIGRSRGELPY